MFGNMMQKLEEQQQIVQEQINALEIKSKSSDGEVSVQINGNHEITNLEIDFQKINNDSEMLEDLIITTLNKAHLEINQTIEELTKNTVSDIIPSGLGNLFG